MGPGILVASLLCLLGSSVVHSRTIFLELKNPTQDELSFLQKYGYLPEAQGDADFAYTPQSISEALKKMQAFAGLSQTGVIDEDTKKLFKSKRCGVKDFGKVSRRGRRYVIQQSWNKRSITYRVLNGSSTLPKSRVEALMGEGLAVWAPHGGLQFTRLDHGQADITVHFASGDHGDGFPFDGPGRVVAHAFPPPHGAMHFDEDEVWGDVDDSASEEDDDITDFFAVAVHEIGHALGLSHSNVKASVMYPYYQVPVDRLHMDDILGMQELYLKEQSDELEEAPSSEASVPRFTKADSEEWDEPDLCLTNYDTLQTIHGNIYVFEEEWVWVLRARNELAEGSPRRVQHVFRGLPARVAAVRAVYERADGHVLIFSGREYWQFSPSLQLVRRGDLSEYSPQLEQVTSVFISNYNNKTYLIDEDRFWRYDEKTHTMDKGYPKEMSAWRDLPYPVDAALIWKGDTYFFRGPRFWRFDNELVAAHPHYPLPVAQVWFACPPAPEMNSYVTNDGP